MVDAYGLPCLLGQQEESSLDSTLQARRRAKGPWDGFGKAVATNNPSLTSTPPDKLLTLKPLVRKGIAFDSRPDAWFLISGAKARAAAAPVGHYKDLTTAPVTPELLYSIEEDLGIPANFPFRAHPLYQSRYGLEALRRLLVAYANHNEGGYFRGLHCIAAFMLIVMGTAKEEEAFWTLACLLEDRVFPYCNGHGALGSKVELRVLQAQLVRKLPKVAVHLEALECSVAAIASSWFATLFTTLLPAETTARVWDALLLEGHKVAQRTALAILRQFETTLCASSLTPVQLRKVLDTRAAQLYDAEGLMALAFRGIGSMPGVHLGVLRAAAQREVEAQAQARQRALALLTGCRVH